MTYWKVVKTIENKRIYFLCLALSQNQYLRVPTHFTWSYHILWEKSLSTHRVYCFNSWWNMHHHWYWLYIFHTQYLWIYWKTENITNPSIPPGQVQSYGTQSKCLSIQLLYSYISRLELFTNGTFQYYGHRQVSTQL